jgi:hypothetical protein
MIKRLGSLLVIAAFSLIAVPAASATPGKLCIPEKASAEVKSPNAEGNCAAKYTGYYVPTEAEEEVLQHLTYVAKGEFERPEIKISGVNVHLYSTTGGLGSLLIGETPVAKESESFFENSLVVGNSDYVKAGTGIVVFGKKNNVEYEGPSKEKPGYSDILGGENNRVRVNNTVIVGGLGNSNYFDEALFQNGEFADILGGQGNDTEGNFSTIIGGSDKNAQEEYEDSK